MHQQDIRQMIIGPDGRQVEVPAGPRTWDGEPLYSVYTVREGLFDLSAFKQMRGQMALEDGS